MNRDDFERELRRLREASGGARKRMIADGLRVAARASWYAESDHATLVRELGVLGIAPPEWFSRPLDVGEAWLAVCAIPKHLGRLTRIRVLEHDGPPCSEALRLELGRALRAVREEAARQGRAWPSELHADRVAVDSQDIEGASLHVALAAAALSRANRRAPRSDTIASAQIDSSGRLRPVECLAHKVDAVRRARPDVRRIVVSRHQPDAESIADGFEAVRCDSLDEALRELGIDFEPLRRADEGKLELRLAALVQDERAEGTTEEFIDRATRGMELAFAFERRGETDHAAMARSVSALCSLHGGDSASAEAALSGASEASMVDVPELAAFAAIVHASTQIDLVGGREAVAAARGALERAESLPKHGGGVELRASALGTLGRALMHDGQLDEAVGLLRRAVDAHPPRRRQEVPRSRMYLAQCLRLMGSAREALETCDEAVREILSMPNTHYLRKTRPFVELERGRALVQLARPMEAVDAFERVRAHQSEDSSYPRLGAVRGLAMAQRMLGNTEDADRYLGNCLAVARSASSTLLRRVATMSLGDCVVLSGSEWSSEEHAEVWRRSFPGDPSVERVRATVRSWVY